VFQNTPSLRNFVVHVTPNRKKILSPVNSTVRPLGSLTDPVTNPFKQTVTKCLLIFTGTGRYVYFSNHTTKGSYIISASGAANLRPEIYIYFTQGTFENPEN